MGNCCSSTAKVAGETRAGDNESLPQEQQPHFTYMSFDTFFHSTENPTVCEYLFKKEFGKGAMSRVYQAEHIETHELFAAKVYNLQQLNKHALRSEEPPIVQVQKEMDIMMLLDHRYTLALIEALEHELTESLILIMPFASLGNVQDLLDKKEMTQEMIIVCFHQIAVGLQYMHSKNFVHRDIKNENFLAFQPDYYVLSDFSVSQELESPDQMLDDTKGSPAFLSPEECSGEAFKPKPADVWSYGISLYLALYGKLPFKLDDAEACPLANTVLMVTTQLEKEELTFPDNPDIDPFAEDLIRQCLEKDPEKRITFDEIPKHTLFRTAWELDAEREAEDEAAQQEAEQQEQLQQEQE